jgi:sec-independent protein translocase protein TatB
MVLVPTIQIASLGMADSFILMVMALVVFGPRRLPQIGRQMGKLMYEFRKASNDFKFQMEEELRNAEEADRRKKEEERLRALALAAPAPAPLEASIAAGTTETGAAAKETASTEVPATDTITPAASYDNGPVASSQAASAQADDTQTADASPTIMPPSIGETVAAARGWSLRHEEARRAEASRFVVPPATVAAVPSTPSTESGSDAPGPATGEAANAEPVHSGPSLSEVGAAQPIPEAPALPASITVNHHG